jgi:hypothetical protein
MGSNVKDRPHPKQPFKIKPTKEEQAFAREPLRPLLSGTGISSRSATRRVFSRPKMIQRNGGELVCGDGSFNHGLSAPANAINAGSHD